LFHLLAPYTLHVSRDVYTLLVIELADDVARCIRKASVDR
jgi:hypothetical protein